MPTADRPTGPAGPPPADPMEFEHADDTVSDLDSYDAVGPRAG